MEKGKNRRSFSSCEHGKKGVPTLFKYLSDPLGPDEAGFETRARSLPLHPTREVLKWHSVAEIYPELTSEGRDQKISIM
jgi:hypothetical protein